MHKCKAITPTTPPEMVRLILSGKLTDDDSKERAQKAAYCRIEAEMARDMWSWLGWTSVATAVLFLGAAFFVSLVFTGPIALAVAGAVCLVGFVAVCSAYLIGGKIAATSAESIEAALLAEAGDVTLDADKEVILATIQSQQLDLRRAAREKSSMLLGWSAVVTLMAVPLALTVAVFSPFPIGIIVMSVIAVNIVFSVGRSIYEFRQCKQMEREKLELESTLKDGDGQSLYSVDSESRSGLEPTVVPADPKCLANDDKDRTPDTTAPKRVPKLVGAPGTADDSEDEQTPGPPGRRT